MLPVGFTEPLELPCCFRLTLIDRLYGPGTTHALRLEERLEQVSKRRARLRDGIPNVTCVTWVPRLELVLREISSELPPYDWSQRDDGKQHTLH